MVNLIGVYECRVDEKGRLMLPVAFKKQLSPHIEQGFIMKKSVFHKCLELYPMAEWVKESSGVSRLNRFVKKNADFIRIFMDGVKTVELDTAGRILIPRDLMQFGEVGREVVLTSMVNRIEIWDKNRYNRFIGEGAERFAELAEEVMGQQNTEATPPQDVP
ncbi:MAG TPA: division/cell wall cluster transcriptional repressor MraZ [Bacteroidales bacterium]|nr:division/cell wall cluster transcriptional repressor MraZ [Bacteroidales bacterium]HRZ48272.1 division/cell wall cluster transcriptional repressor MraZ [Bacteroidales bacterium]